MIACAKYEAGLQDQGADREAGGDVGVRQWQDADVFEERVNFPLCSLCWDLESCSGGSKRLGSCHDLQMVLQQIVLDNFWMEKTLHTSAL